MDSQAARSISQETGGARWALRGLESLAPERDLPAVTLWSRICGATLRIEAQRTEGDQLALAFREQLPVAPAVHGRRLRILELVLEGQTSNYAALELGMAASTVSCDLKRALLALGLSPRFSAIPVYLSQLRHAARREQPLRVREGRFEARQPGYVTLLLPTYDRCLGERLSPVELQVCQLLLAGHTYEEIAAARGTATRTIANQLSSVFVKLGASGRMELVARLASGLPPRAQPRVVPNARAMRLYPSTVGASA